MGCGLNVKGDESVCVYKSPGQATPVCASPYITATQTFWRVAVACRQVLPRQDDTPSPKERAGYPVVPVGNWNIGRHSLSLVGAGRHRKYVIYPRYFYSAELNPSRGYLGTTQREAVLRF